MEINSHPWRLDLDWRWHQLALKLGCRLSIDPDAHSTEEIDLLRWGIAMARKGGVPRERVLSCIDLKEFIAHLAAPQAGEQTHPGRSSSVERGRRMSEADLKFGPLDGRCVHLCIDMQRVFAEPTAWQAPWLPAILPLVQEITARHRGGPSSPASLPPRPPGGTRTWKRYYERWAEMTIEKLGQEMLDLVPELRLFAFRRR